MTETRRLFKGNCTSCGVGLYDYDQKYSDGRITLCSHCFNDYKADNQIIIRHCPGCVENGNNNRFYEWKGLDKFINDYPPDEGWVYKYSNSSDSYGHILMDATYKTEWWVEWHVHNKNIIKELKEGLPLWTPKKVG